MVQRVRRKANVRTLECDAQVRALFYHQVPNLLFVAVELPMQPLNIIAVRSTRNGAVGDTAAGNSGRWSHE